MGSIPLARREDDVNSQARDTGSRRQATSDRRARIKTRHPGIYYREDEDGGNRRYIVWYVCSGCKPVGGCPGHTVTLPNGSLERHAVERRAELMAKKAKGDRVVVTKLTFSEVAQRWLECVKPRVRPLTYEKYEANVRVHLKPRFGSRRLADVSINDVANMVTELQQNGKKGSTIKGVLVPLGSVYEFALRNGWTAANPVRGLLKSERPKRDQRTMEILSTDEIQAMLIEAPSRWAPLLAALTFTGMRLSEALALTWRQVDFDSNTLTVGESKTAAGAGREIILMPELGLTLRKHKLQSSYSGDDDPVFPTVEGKVPAQQSIRSMFERALRNAGVRRVRLHDLRHTCASILIGQGMDVTFVAAQLGHANPAITLSTYAKLFDPERRRDEAREKLSAAFGWMLR
jgi:integrase